MIAIAIGIVIGIAFIAWLFSPREISERPGFVPTDRVAPTGDNDCPDMTCIAYRRRMGLTGRYAKGTPDAIPTVTGHIAKVYPDKATTLPPRVRAEPARAKSSFIPNSTDIELDENSRYPTYGDILIEDQERIRVRLRR